MRVWLFQIGEPLPWQENRRVMRSGRIARELVNRGHEVIWWTNRFDHYSKNWLKPETEGLDADGIHYRLLSGIGYQKNYSPLRLIDHWLVARNFEKLAPAEPRPNLILANLPDHRLAASAVRFGKKHQIPTVLDLRDMWPDLFVERFPCSIRFIARAALCFDEQATRYAIRSADVLITMMNGYLKAAYDKKNRVPRPNDRVFPIGAPDVAEVESLNQRLFSLIREKAQNRKIVSFIGSLNETYTPFSMIDVARSMVANKKIMDCFFVIGGNGPKEAALRKYAKGLEKDVLFTGWLNEAGIAAVLRASSIGYIVSERPVQAFPNKFFTYASAGVPLLCNLMGDLKNLFRENQIGQYLESSSPEVIREALDQLLQNEEQLTACRRNLMQMFDKHFRVDAITNKYVTHLELVSSSFQKK